MSFARPIVLASLAFLPLLVLLIYLGGRFRRATLAKFGLSEAIAHLTTLNRRRRGRSRLCFLGGILLLLIALAGPRWGKGELSIIYGRDLVIVLDLSKSMLTPDMIDSEHPQRWQAAQEGIHDLVAYLRQKGGHRLGLVVFAAKPWVVCPLTADYDHFLMRADEFSPHAPPLEIQPLEGDTFLSGTRIGAAIKEGVLIHDPRFVGYRDLLLISDGDDPALDSEQEIQTGIDVARVAKIPVDVVGLGDPQNTIKIEVRTEEGKEHIASQLDEALLKKIAEQTEGKYLPSRRQTPKLSDMFRATIESNPSRELPEDLRPQPKEQYLWFLAPAIVLLLLAWWMEQ